jgi:hypothetical protein
MKFEAWLKYPEMTIGVHKMNDVFRCHNFQGEQLSRNSFRDCHSILELKFYLLAIPSAPKKEILLLISNLNKRIRI